MLPDLAELLRIPCVDTESLDFLTPDGQWLVYAANPQEQWDIFISSVTEGGNQLLNTGKGTKLYPRCSPCWSASGERLIAFVCDQTGSEEYELCIFALDSGTTRVLDPGFAVEPYFAWSPDGSSIACLASSTGRLYVMPLSGGAPYQLADLTFPGRMINWSPDGKWLAVTAETTGQDTGIFLVPSQGGTAVPLRSGKNLITADYPAFSPDSRTLAFSADPGEFAAIGLYTLESDQIIWIRREQGDYLMPHWSPDGQHLICICRDGPSSYLRLIDLLREEQHILNPFQGVYSHPSFTPDGSSIIFGFENPTHPAGLWQFSLQNGSARPIVHFLPPGKQPGGYFPKEIVYPSLDDQPVPALLFQPKVRGPVPAVILVHGGPNWLTQVNWNPLIQHMLSRGWVVLAPNYRGSLGYGRSWQLANRFDLGGGDTGDVVAGADYLVKSGIALPGRIAITGRSYGGYLTMTSLTGFPHHWAAGSAVVPFLNWFTCEENARSDVNRWDAENMGDPEKDAERFRQRSPFFYLHQVQAPVQLIGGAHDVRCPPHESLQARDELLRLGKTCELMIYEDEGHTFMNKENSIDADLRRIAFLAHYLQPNGEKYDAR